MYDSLLNFQADRRPHLLGQTMPKNKFPLTNKRATTRLLHEFALLGHAARESESYLTKILVKFNQINGNECVSINRVQRTMGCVLQVKIFERAINNRNIYITFQSNLFHCLPAMCFFSSLALVIVSRCSGLFFSDHWCYNSWIRWNCWPFTIQCVFD